MQKPSNFEVYNASAGSGKTFTLVKEYLKILLTNEDIFKFQKILAITFTNKAAGEMKQRVLSNLEDFSEGRQNDLFDIILDEIVIDKIILQERSKKILEVILQNYSAFSITTIDSFTHKIVKSFAYDLGLSLNFEVEMDAVGLLDEAVDVLISKIGTDKKVTKLLIDYSLDKIDDDKSWDISNDLSEYAKILLKEEDIDRFKKLSFKSIEEFTNLKSKLFTYQKELKIALQKIAKDCLELIEGKGLQHKDFIRGSIPKFFNDLCRDFSEMNFLSRGQTIEKAFDNHQYYTKSTSDEVAQAIESIVPEIKESYKKAKIIYSQFLLNNSVLKNIIPLAVLNNINQELENLKEENNIRLNAEFNQLISVNIKEQPAPFIYERIGQRYQHYFIDEMQDTSVLQWSNLVPLIDNALSQENSNLLLVGDGKQAIYRWRGGKAEQFIGLGSNINPFQVDKSVRNLETNYRSYSEIIGFNNSFFQHASKFMQNESYKNIFIKGNTQLENAKKGGFVSLNFLEKTKNKDYEEYKYPQKVLERVNHLKTKFSLNEICVLTRTKKDGIEVASYLSENGIDIVSSETLLLKNSSEVNFIIDILKLVQNPYDDDTRFNTIYFLYHHLRIETSKHIFLREFSKESLEFIGQSLKKYGVFFDLNAFQQLPFYEKIEEIIRGFKLADSSNAYLQFFLDVILEKQRKSIEIVEFLEYWELKKDGLSIIASNSSKAVQIMTIHKSKGLEFPVVIFPCDVDIYKQIKPKVWLDQLPEKFDSFKELLIDFNKNLPFLSERGEQIYRKQREELELDNVNLLYVALTRAVEQLHIITEKKILSKGGENTNFYSGIFINYLKQENLWKDDVLEYSFGEDIRIGKMVKEVLSAENHTKFISTTWKEHNMQLLSNSSNLWGTIQKKAIDFGNLFHEILSKIITTKDIEDVLNQYYQQGFLDEMQLEEVKLKINKIVSHKELSFYFSQKNRVFNEREIVDYDNQIVIPDRLVFKDNLVTIMDYKTGAKSHKHHQQLRRYEKVLASMGFEVDRKLLIYINDEIEVAEV